MLPSSRYSLLLTDVRFKFVFLTSFLSPTGQQRQGCYSRRMVMGVWMVIIKEGILKPCVQGKVSQDPTYHPFSNPLIWFLCHIAWVLVTYQSKFFCSIRYFQVSALPTSLFLLSGHSLLSNYPFRIISLLVFDFVSYHMEIQVKNFHQLTLDFFFSVNNVVQLQVTISGKNVVVSRLLDREKSSLKADIIFFVFDK